MAVEFSIELARVRLLSDGGLFSCVYPFRIPLPGPPPLASSRTSFFDRVLLGFSPGISLSLRSSSSCFVYSNGSMIARSMATGRPRWRPRIITAHTMSFESGLKEPEKEKFACIECTVSSTRWKCRRKVYLRRVGPSSSLRSRRQRSARTLKLLK